MDIVRVRNLWNVHFIAGRLRDFNVVDFQIVQQKTDAPLLPEGFSPTSKEYIDIIIAECEGQRVALWVELTPNERVRLREFIMTVYDDAAFEAI
jgi:hypothetical protein